MLGGGAMNSDNTPLPGRASTTVSALPCDKHAGCVLLEVLKLAGSLEASNYYLNRADLHALLGRVSEAARRP
jgi:hypothetical protein